MCLSLEQKETQYIAHQLDEWIAVWRSDASVAAFAATYRWWGCWRWLFKILHSSMNENTKNNNKIILVVRRIYDE